MLVRHYSSPPSPPFLPKIRFSADDESLLILNEEGELFCYESSTGILKFKKTLADFGMQSDSKLFSLTSDGRYFIYHAWDETSGTGKISLFEF